MYYDQTVLGYNNFKNIWAEFDCYISSFGSIK